jgi:hypothetical protein
MVFWRIVGDCIDVFPKLFGALAGLLIAIGNCFTMISRSVLYYELEHARKYKLLTNTDLALAVGEPNRYGGLKPGIAEEIQGRIHERGMESMEEDDA